ncbi:hypothetical protein [Nitrosomonas sp. HPC101]|uniref:hypothetical protein n=1 Tax=Nitrosomonas sp. HPC101 TaxID=1658667 RepID=UPI00136F3154|nr:hypothetical protein [Nitrosomonas sp. HPC101]
MNMLVQRFDVVRTKQAVLWQQERIEHSGLTTEIDSLKRRSWQENGLVYWLW